MSYEIIGYFIVLLVVRAGIVGLGATAVTVVQQPAAAIIRAENYDSPRYTSFGYNVADGLTGDNKAQEETRNGNVVHGSYSLIEPDGFRRVASYVADPINGFNAVQRDPSITVKTAAVAAAPLAAATVHPVAVVAPSVIAAAAAAAPAAVTVRPQAIVVGAPLLRQPFISGTATLAVTNVVAANSGLVGLGVGLGVRSGSLSTRRSSSRMVTTAAMS